MVVGVCLTSRRKIEQNDNDKQILMWLDESILSLLCRLVKMKVAKFLSNCITITLAGNTHNGLMTKVT